MAKKKTTVEEFADTFSKKAVTDILNMIEDESRPYGDSYRQELVTYFLARFIGAETYTKLKTKPTKPMSKAEEADFVTNVFRTHKERIQSAIAAGFQGAMQTFTGKDIEYYCQIKIVPQSPSSAVN